MVYCLIFLIPCVARLCHEAFEFHCEMIETRAVDNVHIEFSCMSYSHSNQTSDKLATSAMLLAAYFWGLKPAYEQPKKQSGTG